MRCLTTCIRFVSIFLLIAVSALAQTYSAQPTVSAVAARAGATVGVVGGGFAAGGVFASSVGGQPVPGMPYSAEQTTEAVQTLADGTHITNIYQQVKVYRDSQGRVRIERSLGPPPGMTAISPPHFVEISDPVAGYRYVLNESEHTARRSPWPPSIQARPFPMNRGGGSATPTQASPASPTKQILPESPARGIVNASRPHPKSSTESLGTDVIEGLVVEGRRTTITFPEGFMGNDRPITITHEIWTSPDLQIVVLSKTTDPRSGETTMRLRNVSRNEPDPTLFQVPPDYSVVEEGQAPSFSAVRVR